MSGFAVSSFVFCFRSGKFPRDPCTRHLGRMDVGGWRTRPPQDFSQIVLKWVRFVGIIRPS